MWHLQVTEWKGTAGTPEGLQVCNRGGRLLRESVDYTKWHVLGKSWQTMPAGLVGHALGGNLTSKGGRPVRKSTAREQRSLRLG